MIEVLVGAREYARIAAAKIQRTWAGDRDLGYAVSIRFEERDIVGIDRMCPLHAAADDRDRLLAPPATILATFGIGAVDCINAEFTELTIEEAVIRATAEFAIGDKFEADLFLQADGLANSRIFLRRQCGLIDFATDETGPLGHQFWRPQ